MTRGWVDHGSKADRVLEWSDGMHFTGAGVCEGNGHGGKEDTHSILISIEKHGEAMVSSQKRAKLRRRQVSEANVQRRR